MTLADTSTSTSLVTELPELGAMKHNVTVYAPDDGVLLEQVESGTAVGVAVGVGVLPGVAVAVGVGVGVFFPRE
jgi:hypothetical protein